MKELSIYKLNQVLASDITYILRIRGIIYLAAIMEFSNSCFRDWRLSRDLDQDLVLTDLQKAPKRVNRKSINRTRVFNIQPENKFKYFKRLG